MRKGYAFICSLGLAMLGSTARGEERSCLFGDPGLSLACAGDVCGEACPEAGCTALPAAATLFETTTLTGDWNGRRTSLEESGILFNGDLTQFYFGVANGGRQRHFEYGGHGDYLITADAGKMGLQEGLSIRLRAEHRFGETISRSTGALLPATAQADLPVSDSERLFLTNVLFTQMLSENWGVFFGKMDTLDGDLNAYAHGRGKTQFSNMGFIANPILLRTVPYSTLAAGLTYIHEMNPLFTMTVMNPVDSSGTSGFEELFTEGATLAVETRIPTNFFDLPGHHLFGGVWCSQDFISLRQDPRIITGEVPIARQSNSWGLYWNFDQTLVSYCGAENKGWGVFGRAGLGDDTTNPLAWFLSFGVGGNSPVKHREEDTFGVGWYMLGISNEIGPLLGNIGNGQAVELYYNYQVNPWFTITPDFQVLMPAHSQADSAVVVGLRANIVL